MRTRKCWKWELSHNKKRAKAEMREHGDKRESQREKVGNERIWRQLRQTANEIKNETNVKRVCGVRAVRAVLSLRLLSLYKDLRDIMDESKVFFVREMLLDWSKCTCCFNGLPWLGSSIWFGAEPVVTWFDLSDFYSSFLFFLKTEVQENMVHFPLWKRPLTLDRTGAAVTFVILPQRLCVVMWVCLDATLTH